MKTEALPLVAPPPLHNISKTDLPAATLSLANSFADDPLMCYLVEDPKRRHDLFRRIFSLFIKHTFKWGNTCASCPKHRAVAIWSRPGDPGLNLWEMIRCGALSLAFNTRSVERQRLLSFPDFAAGLHEKYVPAPHWYLMALGTLKEFRGAGLASGLISWVLDKADAEGTPCFLETNNSANLRFYERFGFAIMEETVIPGTDVGHWAMMRPSKRGSGS